MKKKDLTEKDFLIAFTNNSADSSKPLTWIKLCSLLEITLEEAEELAKDKEWARVIKIYKQKCKASLIQAIKKEPRLVLEYYKQEYSEDKKEDPLLHLKT